jgi:putative ABC transport system permease protein
MRRVKELPGVDRRGGGHDGSVARRGQVSARDSILGDGHVRGRAKKIRAGGCASDLAGIFRGAGRSDDRRARFQRQRPQGREPVVIVSQSVAQRMFPGSGRGEPSPDVDRSGDEVHRHQQNAAAHCRGGGRRGRRERGAGSGDDRVSPVRQEGFGAAACSCTRTANPYALVTPITRIIRDLSADQPVERAATLEDIRAEVLTPDRLNTLVFGGFAAVALADCGGGRGGRAGVFGERADARVRHPPGDRIAAAAIW